MIRREELATSVLFAIAPLSWGEGRVRGSFRILSVAERRAYLPRSARRAIPERKEWSCSS
jgi:hypothetical protein